MSGIIVLILRALLVVALYVFLGTALWVLWKQLAQVSERVPSRQVPRILLEVKTAGELPATRAFAQPEVILGRAPLSDHTLPDEAVSARHALLSFHDGQWWVQDLGSRNGTRLNAAPVTLPTVLADGDEIRCGGTLVSIALVGTPTRSQTSTPGGQNE